jgi:hypothetical protein
MLKCRFFRGNSARRAGTMAAGSLRRRHRTEGGSRGGLNLSGQASMIGGAMLEIPRVVDQRADSAVAKLEGRAFGWRARFMQEELRPPPKGLADQGPRELENLEFHPQHARRRLRACHPAEDSRRLRVLPSPVKPACYCPKGIGWTGRRRGGDLPYLWRPERLPGNGLCDWRR